MKIISADFLESAAAVKQFPATTIPEIAFAGKSNVGKSTLINSLLVRKKLVKTSSTPGKTQLINFFVINGKFHLVDLPGYGFAKVPASVQAQWAKLIDSYLSERRTLRAVVLIIDVRHGPSAADKQLKKWLDHYGIPTIVIANKIDKLKRSQHGKYIKAVKTGLDMKDQPIPHSALDKTGREDVWSAIAPFIFGKKKLERKNTEIEDTGAEDTREDE